MINQSKLRVDLRFYAEMINVGIFTHKEGLPLLGNVLTVLVNMDREEHNNVSIILSFCRHCGEDYAGTIYSTLTCIKANIFTLCSLTAYRLHIWSTLQQYILKIFTLK